LQRQFRAALGFSDLPFIVGRRPVAEEGLSASARAPVLRTIEIFKEIWNEIDRLDQGVSAAGFATRQSSSAA
jgi:hypothetical protein